MFTSEQKEQIIERLTDAMVSIEGENMGGVAKALAAPDGSEHECDRPMLWPYRMRGGDSERPTGVAKSLPLAGCFAT